MRLGALLAIAALLGGGAANAQGLCGAYKSVLEGAADGFAGLRGAELENDVYESTATFAGSRLTDCTVDASSAAALQTCAPFFTKEEAARTIYTTVLKDVRGCFTDARVSPQSPFPAGSRYSLLEGFTFELPSGPIRSIEVSVVRATYENEPKTLYLVDRTLIAR